MDSKGKVTGMKVVYKGRKIHKTSGCAVCGSKSIRTGVSTSETFGMISGSKKFIYGIETEVSDIDGEYLLKNFSEYFEKR